MHDKPPSAESCPADEVLESLARGRLSAAAPWLPHIDQCASCRDRFEQILNSLHALPTFSSDSSFTDEETSPSTEPMGARLRRALGGAMAEAKQLLRPAEGPDELGRLGPYRVLEILGAGGMGLVLLADEPALGRRVALKVMRPHLAADKSAHRRFLREARAMALVEHDHVVPIYRVEEDGGVPYVAMPLLLGESLAARLARQQRLPAATAVEIARQVAEGLAAAHAKGLVHRDVKPANVWLELREDGSTRVRLLDFGLARAVEPQAEISQRGAVLGTPAYMSPEQAQGHQVDERSDLFSLGAILYRMATGKSPFAGDMPLAVIRQVIDITPPAPHRLVADLPEGLSKLVEQLLAKEPDKRPRSAREVAGRLAAIGANGPSARSRRMQTRIVLALGAAILALLALGIWAYLRPRTSIGPIPPEQARFEWRFESSRIPAGERGLGQPKELVAQIGSSARRHWGAVHALAAASNGSLLATDSAGDGARFWDPRSLKQIGTAPSRQEFIRAIAVASDGKRFVTTNSNGQFEVWDINPPSAKLAVPPIYAEAAIGGLLMSANGERLFAQDFGDGAVREYELTKTELKLRRTLKERLGEAWSLAASLDGRWLGAASKSGAIGVWDLRDREPRFFSVRDANRADRFFNLAFSPDGKTLYLVSQGAQSAAYDLSSGRPQKSADFTTNSDMVWAAFVANSGQRLIRVGQHSLEIWDVSAKPPNRIGALNVPMTIEGSAYDPQSARVFTGHDDGGVRAWDVGGRQPVEIEPMPYQSLARAVATMDGRFAAIHRENAEGQASLELYDLSGDQPKLSPLTMPIDQGAFGWPEFSPDGKHLFAAAIGSLAVAKWDLSDNSAPGRLIADPNGQPIRPGRRVIRSSADGSRIVSFDLEQSAHFVFDCTGSGRSPWSLRLPTEPKDLTILDGSFDLGDRGLIALGKAGERPYFIRWNELGAAPVVKPLAAEYSWPRLHVGASALTAFGFRDGAVFEFGLNEERPRPRKIFGFEPDDGVGRTLALRPDGNWIAASSSGGRLVIVDRSSGRVVHDVRLPGAPIEMSFTHTGDGLLTANPNGTVFLFRFDRK